MEMTAIVVNGHTIKDTERHPWLVTWDHNLSKMRKHVFEHASPVIIELIITFTF